MANMERVNKALDWIDEHPEHWDQDFFIAGYGGCAMSSPPTAPIEEDCGTTLCFAGAALLVHGLLVLKEFRDSLYDSYWMYQPIEPTGESSLTFGPLAQLLLELTGKEADLIFYDSLGENEDPTPADFRQYVYGVLNGSITHETLGREYYG